MRLLPRTPAARRGFTLIELLVVIAVIAILVGLLMAAVMGAFSKGPATQDRADVSGLTAALQEFKGKYGFYPPSRLFLCNSLGVYKNNASDPLVQDSLRCLSAMFPNMNWSNVGWANGLGMPAWSNGLGKPSISGTNVKAVVLEGDQCLVFFLGGLPGPSNSVAGFSASTTNPTAAGGQRFKFYDFPTARLTSIHGNAFLSYKNGHLNQPYAYFSVGRRGQNQYNSSWTTAAGGGTGLGATSKNYQNSDCNFTKTSLGVNPYASAWGSPPTFINPDSFQLISAGPDGNFGPGTTSAATVWSSSNASAVPTNGKDDISNFSDRNLGVSQ